MAQKLTRDEAIHFCHQLGWGVSEKAIAQYCQLGREEADRYLRRFFWLKLESQWAERRKSARRRLR